MATLPLLVARYAVAVGSVVIVTMIRMALVPLWGESVLPFFLYVPAIVLAAWVGRFGPACVAVGLSAIASWEFGIGADRVPEMQEVGKVLAIVSFIVVGLCVSIALEAMHRANEHAVAELGERRRSEMALRESEQRERARANELQAIMEAVPAVIWITRDVDSSVISGNRASYELLRLSADTNLSKTPGNESFPDNFDFRLFGRVLTPNELPVQRAARGEEVRGLETELTLTDGTSRCLYGNATPLRDSAGNLCGAIAAFIDITDRRHAEESLRESEARFRLMADGLPLMVWVHDADGAQEFVNFQFANFFGVKIEEMNGDRWKELLHPDDVQDYIQAFKNALVERRPFQAQARVRRADGEWRWIESWAQPRFSSIGAFLGYVGASTDITDRKQTEAALRDSEAVARARAEELSAIMEAMPAFVFLAHDPECRMVTSGRGTRELLRLPHHESAAEMVPDPSAFRNFRLLRDGRELAPHELPLQTAAATGQAVHDAEVTIQFADGSSREIFGNAVPLFDASGRVRGAVGAFVDITDRKQAEQQLGVARDQALAANRAKDDFLAMLSHELRTPLNPVLLVATDAAQDPSLPEAVRSNFEMIAGNVALEARLIDDLLDVHRIVRGKVVLDREPLDVHATLRDVIATVRENAEAKQLSLTEDLAATHHTVSGDPVRLRQVFWNLLKNAVKFTQCGRIAVTTANIDDDRTIEVRFLDTGLGMTEAELKRVFQPFMQGDHATQNGMYGGLGLGLAISQTLIECHQGAIFAQSAGPGKGSCFVVRLPVIADRVAPKIAATNQPGGEDPATAVPRRVLLVEDHLATRTALALLLKRRGCIVTAAGSLGEARKIIAEQAFDILISDLGLPDGDGCELMRELQQQQPGTVGIAITGYGMAADVSRSQDAGFCEHLTKPVNIASLERAFERLVMMRERGEG